MRVSKLHRFLWTAFVVVISLKPTECIRFESTAQGSLNSLDSINSISSSSLMGDAALLQLSIEQNSGGGYSKEGSVETKVNGEVSGDGGQGTGNAEASATGSLKVGHLGGVQGNATAKTSGNVKGSYEGSVSGGGETESFKFHGSASGNVKGDAQGSASGSLNGRASLGNGISANAEGKFDAHARVEINGDASGAVTASGNLGDCDKTVSICGNSSAHGSVEFVVVVKGDGKANFSLSDGGSAFASGSISASVSASANLNGKVVITGFGTTSTISAAAKGYAEAGASASGEAIFSLGDDKPFQIGAIGTAQVGASVGVAASGDINIGEWLHAGGTIGLSFGTSIAIGGGMIISVDDCKFSTKGAGQAEGGVGVSFSGNIQVNPCKLVTEIFDNAEKAIIELAATGQKDGQECVWGPNCDGFELSGPGMDCCENKCQRNVLGPNNIYTCKNGVVPFLQQVVAVKNIGESCLLDINCKGHQFHGPGTACCFGQCKEKIQDFAGNYWCPEVAIAAKKLPLGSECHGALQCDGGTLFGEGNFCCGNSGTPRKTCQTKVKDWAGFYYCPNEAVLKLFG